MSAKFDIVSGYVSGQDIDLAVERGEFQCRAFTITAYYAREPFISWRKRNFTNVLVQTGSQRDARIKETPTIYELMDRYKTSAAGRTLAKVILASGDLGRPIVAPPGVPADRIKILRDGFDKTLADPAFLAEAEKRRLEIDPTKWDEMESLAKDVMTTPPDVVARMRKALGRLRPTCATSHYHDQKRVHVRDQTSSVVSVRIRPIVFCLWRAPLHAQTPFYQGKTIRLVAGTPAGSVYDLYARMVAQFIPKHIPGNPNVIVQNMPGVASMVAANYIYTVAKPDGLTIGSIQPALYFDQLVGPQGSSIRLAKIYLDRQHHGVAPFALHAQRHAV